MIHREVSFDAKCVEGKRFDMLSWGDAQREKWKLFDSHQRLK